MTRALKLQIATTVGITFVAGVAFGIYLTSQFIGNFIPELAK